LLLTDGAAVPSVDAQLNIASVSNAAGTGVYTLTFATAFPDTNYICLATVANGVATITAKTTTTCNVNTFAVGGVAQDGGFNFCAYHL
jgi:hypothetical protein